MSKTKLLCRTLAGPAKKRIKVPKVESRQPLHTGTSKLEALTVWRNSALFAGPNTLGIRLDLAEISKKTQNRLFLATFLA